MYWLGIDIGTGSSRALLVNDKGAIVAGATAMHEDIHMERPMWAEQRPEDWWSAAQNAIREVLTTAGATGEDVRAVGLSGQMHGLVILDDNHAVIRPALIWCDQRSQAQVDWINQTVGKQKVLDCIANPVLTGFTLPKLIWVRDNEPTRYERIRKMLLPKDYIRFMLTGEFATEVSDASGTALFDVVNRRWSFELASAVGVDKSILPASYESSEVSGRINSQAAALTGLAEGTPVVGGGGDQAASAVGNGIVETGIVSCTIGTSGVVFAHMDNVAYDPAGRVHTFCHAVTGKWHVMGVTQGAGLSLQWFRNQLMPGADYDAMTAEAATATAGAQGLFWLPYLMGERTPHLDAAARGGFFGLTARHTRADLIRAVIEGVSFSLADCLQIIEGMEVAVESVRVSGGGGKNTFWRQLLADIFAKKVVTLETQEGSAHGAALLALAGSTNTPVPEVCRQAVREVESLSPRAAEAKRYRAAHEVYQAIYPALKPIYGQIEALG